MKAALVALTVVTIAALTAAPAEARRHHRYAYGCHQYEDYTRSSRLSVLTFIYPAADWGPFFHCRMYYSTVISAPLTPAYVY